MIKETILEYLISYFGTTISFQTINDNAVIVDRDNDSMHLYINEHDVETITKNRHIFIAYTDIDLLFKVKDELSGLQ